MGKFSFKCDNGDCCTDGINNVHYPLNVLIYVGRKKYVRAKYNSFGIVLARRKKIIRCNINGRTIVRNKKQPYLKIYLSQFSNKFKQWGLCNINYVTPQIFCNGKFYKSKQSRWCSSKEGKTFLSKKDLQYLKLQAIAIKDALSKIKQKQ